MKLILFLLGGVYLILTYVSHALFIKKQEYGLTKKEELWDILLNIFEKFVFLVTFLLVWFGYWVPFVFVIVSYFFIGVSLTVYHEAAKRLEQEKQEKDQQKNRLNFSPNRNTVGKRKTLWETRLEEMAAKRQKK